MAEKKKKFEESLENLKKIAENLKKEDISLDEAIKNFEEGQKYYKECNELLNAAKQKIETYLKNEGEIS